MPERTQTYVDSSGESWIIEQKALFGEPWNTDIIEEVFGRALVKVRREGEFGGVWLRAQAKWDTELAMAELIEEVKETLRRVR